MSTLPVLLKDPRILLLGGGNVALHKATVLQENQVRFELMASCFSEAFKALNLKQVMQTKEVELTDLRPFNIIIDATGNQNVKNMLCNEKERRFLLLNIVDDPDSSDFYFAALLNYGRLKIAVSTDGASPTLGQVVRDRIKNIIPENIASFIEDKAFERAKGKIDREATRVETLQRLAQVFLVGCGPGDVNLLTLQACRCIENAEVVLYDHLITQEILELIPERVEKIYVGKQKQASSFNQEEINTLILHQVQRGLRVVQLKSGNPYVSGRDAEQAEFLSLQGVKVRIIPGITLPVQL